MRGFYSPPQRKMGDIAHFDFSMFRMQAEKCWHSSRYSIDPGKKGCFFSCSSGMFDVLPFLKQPLV